MSTQIAGETKIRQLKDRKEVLKAAGDEVGVRECNRKIRLLKEKYNEITLKAGLDTHYDRMSVVKSRMSVVKSQKEIDNARENAIIEKSRLRITQVRASTITEKINSGEYNTKMSKQQFLKHKEGSPQFENYKNDRAKKNANPQSVLTIDEKTAQKIIVQKAGTGIVRVSKSGEPRPVEDIDCGYVIGKYYGNGQYHNTTKASIHYGKKGSHIVPIRGDNFG